MTNSTIELTCIEQVEAVDDDLFFFSGEGSEKFILKNGVIRQKAYKHILTSKVFAEEYLNLIRTNQIDMDWQTQHLVILDKLYSLINGGRWDYRELAPFFKEAMIALFKKATQKLTEIQNHEAILDGVQQGYEYYAFNGLVSVAMTRARSAAVMGMIRKFAEQYSSYGGYSSDLFGKYSFELTKPKVNGIVSWLARDYFKNGKLSTRISAINDGAWSLRFFNLIPFSDTGRLKLAVETYSAAIPVLESALEMNAAVYWELVD